MNLVELGMKARRTDAMFAEVLKMFKAAAPVTERADWCKEDSKEPCCHAAMETEPKSDELDAVLRNLVGFADHKGKKITEVCPGIFGSSWACFARLA